MPEQSIKSIALRDNIRRQTINEPEGNSLDLAIQYPAVRKTTRAIVNPNHKLKTFHLTVIPSTAQNALSSRTLKKSSSQAGDLIREDFSRIFSAEDTDSLDVGVKKSAKDGISKEPVPPVIRMVFQENIVPLLFIHNSVP